MVTTHCSICAISNPKYHCGKCKVRKYCSQDCQIKDWEAGHQKLCKTLTNKGGNTTINYLSSPIKKQQDNNKKRMLLQLPQYVKGCKSNHRKTQIKSTTKLRKLLSVEGDPPITAVLNTGILPRLVKFLKCKKYPKLQFEAAWCITNIASGTAENTTAVIEQGAVPILVKLLKSKSLDVIAQAVWALGNISGDCPESRDLVLSYDALLNLLPICNTKPLSQQKLTLLRNATWTLSNFCRGKPAPDWKYIELAIKALNVTIKRNDLEILQDSCWAFSYLSDVKCNDYLSEIKQTEAIMNSGSLDRLFDLLDHKSPHVRHPALRTIGNIVTGPDHHVQKFIDLGILEKLSYLIKNDRAPIKREACWAVSNITAGSKEQIEAVIKANLFPLLIDILSTEKYEISKEALWAIHNATKGATDAQIAYLVNKGVINPLCVYLTGSLPPKIAMVALEAIDYICAAWERLINSNFYNLIRNQFAIHVKKAQGLMYLKQWKSNKYVPEEIKDKVDLIINKYFIKNAKCDQCGVKKKKSVQLKLCRKCKGVFYCSKHCQKIAWKRKHRFYCLKYCQLHQDTMTC